MIRQRAELTYKGNHGLSRHDWLRLTPAYSARLVEDALRDTDPEARVLDPFGGSGTTALLAAERGHESTTVDLNPFLIWFAEVKTAPYEEHELQAAVSMAEDVLEAARNDDAPCWLPALFRIERWWGDDALSALGRLRSALFAHPDGPERNLLAVAFARTMIATSNAAFNHQSMSFKDSKAVLWDKDVFEHFAGEVEHVLTGAQSCPRRTPRVVEGDARTLAPLEAGSFDLLCTSPPYANRMSYIRELRPYMYWLGFLEDARHAGELDWRAIGGTWGVATSRVGLWEPTDAIPLNGEFSPVIAKIADGNEKSGRLLSRYVEKYFHDVWSHTQAAYRVMASGGTVTYIVGNSTFSKIHVPTHDWYAALLSEAGFRDIAIEIIRKRNSNKALYEFAVMATKP
jgi:DNA modification methylase